MISEESLLKCNVFGKRLKLLRLQQQNTSPEMFAERIEITCEELEMLESGKVLPEYETLLALHAKTDIDIQDIIDETFQVLESKDNNA